MRTVLLVAAQAREFRGLLRMSRRVRRLGWPLDWARSGECGGRRLIMVANGCGSGPAALATREALSREPAGAVVSFGFCGALDPSLAIGDIFVATGIESNGESFAARAPATDLRHASGLAASRDRIAQTAAEKAALRSGGASVVEMEAAGVARESRVSGLPFYSIRAVTDLAAEDFAIDLNSALRADGHFATIKLLRVVLWHPGIALPELLRLRERCRIAAWKLGEFVAECRF